MSKLEAKHVLPYVLYGAKMFTEKNLLDKEDRIWTLQPSNFPNNWNADFNSKIILRPLSQIKEYFEPIFEKDKEVNEYLSYEATTPFSVDEILNYKFEYLLYGTCQVLLKHHFDLFGLIEKGLAVDINTLSVE